MSSIDERAIYPIGEFQKRVGLTRHGVRTARRNGLRVYYVHARCYIWGADWLAYLKQNGTGSRLSSRPLEQGPVDGPVDGPI